MNVFISWSGAVSREVARAIKNWLKPTLQRTDPFMSSEDIATGSRWFAEIAEKLEASDVGILCLTSANLHADWLLFEAGALSKHLGRSRLCVLLIDLKPTDLQPPLSEFQACTLEKSDMYKLLLSLNLALGQHALAENDLDRAFQDGWDRLREDIAKALRVSTDESGPVHQRSDRDLLEELVQLTRNLAMEFVRTSNSNQQQTGPFAPKTFFQIQPDAHVDFDEHIEKLGEFQDVTRGS